MASVPRDGGPATLMPVTAPSGNDCCLYGSKLAGGRRSNDPGTSDRESVSKQCLALEAPMSVALEYRTIRAPRHHGGVHIDPELDEAEPLLKCSRRMLKGYELDIQGRDFSRLAAEARRELLTRAHAYTRVYRDAPPLAHEGDGRIVMAGHQPQLFHAGVWFKNFVLSSIAERAGGVAVNLLIDNDILRNASIRCPSRSGDLTHITTVPFDIAADPIAYEERDVLDVGLFESFGPRVESHLEGIVDDPIVKGLWPRVRESHRRTGRIGRSLAEARHALEGDWGQETLELPLSDVCRGESFRWFSAHLLAHLPRFQEIYNSSLAEYRRLNRLRSHSHPVPDLAAENEWLEAPFWIWSKTAPHRRHLFVRQAGDQIELSDRGELSLRLDLSAESELDQAVEQWEEGERDGIRVRPRALITTMYARMVLSDLFLHGIGGAKYDQLTDLIIHRFFGVVPPRYMTISATALLFEDRTEELDARLRENRRLLRELDYHPERFVDRDGAATTLIQEKLRWIGTELPRGQRRPRHMGIENTNLALQPFVADRREQCQQDRIETEAMLRRQTPMASREFPFCLFPEANLRTLLQELSAAGVPADS